MKQGLLAALVMLALSAAAVWLNLKRADSLASLKIDWTLAPRVLPAVQIEPPAIRTLTATISAPGVVEAIEEAQIASQVIGRVVKVAVKEGDRVAQGDLLVKLDPADAQARLDSATARQNALHAAIDQAKADLEKARRDLERLRDLSTRRASSSTEMADALSMQAKMSAALERARHELTESDAAIREAREYLERTEIKAPIPGVVANLDVEVGEVVIAGTTNLPGTVLMSIVDLERMRIRAEVDETDIVRARPGQIARVYLQADPDHPIPGVVDRIAPKGTKTGDVVTFQTLIDLPSPSALARAAMTTTVEIEVETAENVLSVPIQAVVHRRRKDLPDTPEVRAWAARDAARTRSRRSYQPEETRYVKVVFLHDPATGTVHARPVETGVSNERYVQILDGLTAEDRVVVGPFRALDELKDGDAVTLEPHTASPGEESPPPSSDPVPHPNTPTPPPSPPAIASSSK